jgi:hypothetical protein
MHCAMLLHLETPGNTNNFHSRLEEWVLGLYVRNGCSLFILINPANFDSMSHDHEPMAFNACSVSKNPPPCLVLYKESLSGKGVSCDRAILTD